MKKGIVFLTVLILILPMAYATLNVQLTSPNGNTFDQKNVDFTCSAASGNTSLQSIALYFGNETTWHENKTISVSGLNVTQIFSVQNIPNGNYLWNCKARLTNLSETFASANLTFAVNYIETPPPVNHAPQIIADIPDKKWYVGQQITIILSDYFLDSDNDPLTYTVTGNSNININIVNNLATVIPQDGWVGVERVTFIANDGSLSAPSNEIILNVTENNRNNHPLDENSPIDENVLINNNLQIIGHYPLESIYMSNGNETFYINVTSQNATYIWTLNGNTVSTERTYTLSNNKPGMYTLMAQANSGEQTLDFVWQVTIPNAQANSKLITTKPAIKPILPSVCGDGKKDGDENCETCAKDAACENGYSCVAGGKCQKKSLLPTIIVITFIIMALLTAGYFSYEYLLKGRIKKKTETIDKEAEAIKKGVAEPAEKLQEPVVIPTEEPKAAEIPAQKPAITESKPIIRQPKKVKKEDIIKDYVTKMLDKGHKEDEIINNLIKTGWSRNLVNEIIKSVKLNKQAKKGMIK